MMGIEWDNHFIKKTKHSRIFRNHLVALADEDVKRREIYANLVNGLSIFCLVKDMILSGVARWTN